MAVLSAGTLNAADIGIDLAIAFGGALIIGATTGVIWAFGLRALRARRARILVVAAMRRNRAHPLRTDAVL